MEEIFKDIKDYEGLYQISNFGNVKSLNRFRKNKSGGFSKLLGIKLKVVNTTNGYLRYSLYKNSISKMKSAHRLVAICFIPNHENKKEVNHINGIKTDNRVENLEWCTRSENNQHAFDTGLHIPHDCKGSKNGKSKLKEYQVLEIISLLKTKNNTELSFIYGVTRENISSIRHNKLWKHIQR